MHNEKKFGLIAVVGLSAFFFSCSSDDNSVGTGRTTSVQSMDGLGECSTSNEGSVFWVESENKGYICSMGNWLYDAQIVNPNIGKASTQQGYIIDARDGQQYKTVFFDGVTWLAQNLNYAVANTDSISSKCYLEDPANCSVYGRLYSRAAAALSNICPEGFEIVDGGVWKWLKAHYESNMLKTTTGWTYWNEAINPNNVTGFGLQASGYCAKYNECNALAYEGRYWAFSGDDANEYVSVYYNRNDMELGLKSLSPMDHNAIRCVSKNIGNCSAENLGEFKSLIGHRYYCNGSQWLDEKKIAATSIYDYPSKDFFFNPTISYGTMTDPRDGKTYRTTTIGSQVWMAENLDYVTVGGIADDGIGSWCYANQPLNCKLTGRFYSKNAVESGVLCPGGWHIPLYQNSSIINIGSQDEFHSQMDVCRFDVANAKVYGDEYGFSGLATGYYLIEEGTFEAENYYMCFWGENSYGTHLCGSAVWGNRSVALPVRCVKD